MTAEWVTGVLDVLDPDREPGRITLIHRKSADKLPLLVDTARCANRTVLRVCDPMHGYTALRIARHVRPGT